MDIEEELAQAVARAEDSTKTGSRPHRHRIIASALMPLVRRAQAEAIRQYAVARFGAFLVDPDAPWAEQPSELAQQYKRLMDHMISEADRIELEVEHE